MTSIRFFKVPKDTENLLTPNEKEMLPFLIKAVKGVDKIFRLQENQINNGANFYPRDAIKSEIEKAAKKNPEIFSPFTIVTRDKTSQLKAISYHMEYSQLLRPIVKNLQKAAKICQNQSFKKYLEILAESLLDGSYEKIDKAWLNVKESNLDIVIGPYERYLDKLFFIKKAYQGNVSIIDGKKTERAGKIRDVLYSSITDKPRRVIPPSIVEVRAEHSLIFSGFLGRALFTQQHLPSNSETVEKYGSRILGYLTSLDYKFEKLIYPIFNVVFEKTFRDRYSKKLIKEGSYYHILLHGIVQHLHRYKGSRNRLRELFPIYDEANTVASGIQYTKYLILKGVIDQKELEAIMIAQICWIFSELVFVRQASAREVYLKGDALIFNFLKKEGALQEKHGISWPNFAKMFFEMENLALIFTRILEEGSYREANNFLNKYLFLDSLSSFGIRLAELESI